MVVRVLRLDVLRSLRAMDVHLNLLNAKIGWPLRPFNVPVPLEVFAEVKLPELLLLLFLRGHNLLKLILVVHIKHTVF